jgi:integrase
VSRDTAREKAAELLDLLHHGGNPQTAHRKRQASPTFEMLAREYVEDRKPRWKDSSKSAAQWLSSLSTYAFPLIGSTKIRALSVDDVLAVLRPLWADKHVTAGRVRSRISVIWRAARAQGLVSGDDPADLVTITAILPPLHKTRRVKHHSAIPWQELPALWAELRANGSTSALALMWTIATVARTGATIGARFDEAHLTGKDAPLWTVKGERLKGSDLTPDHRTPLSAAALEVLSLVPPGEPDDFIFKGGKPGAGLSNMAMLELLKGLRPGMGYTVHGMRAAFVAWADNNGIPELIRERILQHVEKDKVIKAYSRDELLEPQREALKRFARFLSPPAAKPAAAPPLRRVTRSRWMQ